jgi:hypothetical protein
LGGGEEGIRWKNGKNKKRGEWKEKKKKGKDEDDKKSVDGLRIEEKGKGRGGSLEIKKSRSQDGDRFCTQREHSEMVSLRYAITHIARDPILKFFELGHSASQSTPHLS